MAAEGDRPNVELDVYSFVTTAPNALTVSINHEQMPVLLSEKAGFETWLSGSPAEAFALARTFDPALMQIGAARKKIYWAGKLRRNSSAYCYVRRSPLVR